MDMDNSVVKEERGVKGLIDNGKNTKKSQGALLFQWSGFLWAPGGGLLTRKAEPD